MARIKKSFISSVMGALSAMLPGNRTKTSVTSLGGDDKKFHGGQNFTAWWTGLKGAPGRLIPGMTELPQWKWPDKAQYGQHKDGSIRHATPQIPFRVRRWRKRSAARLVKANPTLTIAQAQGLVKKLESGILKSVVKDNA